MCRLMTGSPDSHENILLVGFSREGLEARVIGSGIGERGLDWQERCRSAGRGLALGLEAAVLLFPAAAKVRRTRPKGRAGRFLRYLKVFNST